MEHVRGSRTGRLTSRLAGTWGLRLLVDRRFLDLVAPALLGLVLVYRALQLFAWSSTPQWGYDFSAYWTAARHVLDSEPLYSAAQLAGPYAPQGQTLYLYPPFLAAFVVPLALAWPGGYGAANAVWALLGALAGAAAVLGVARLEGIAPTRRGRLLLIGATFAFPPVVGELVLGNVHLMLLGLLALAWWGIRRGDATGEMIGGVAVAAATLIKVFPILLVVWFLATGRFRATAWAMLGGAVLVFLSLPITGVRPWLDYPVALLNLGRPSDVTDALAPAVWLGELVDDRLARLAVLGVAVVLIAWVARRRDDWTGYAMAVTVAVLAAPAVFQHYLAILVLPLLLALAATPPTAAPRAALAAAYLAMWGGQQPLLGGFAWVLNRAVPTLGTVGLAGILAGWGRARPGAGRPRPGRVRPGRDARRPR